jgi:aryl-alcohol dehydrogenase-like predicted oxidoreductase
VGAITEMVDAGYVRHVGLSEVDAATVSSIGTAGSSRAGR